MKSVFMVVATFSLTFLWVSPAVLAAPDRLEIPLFSKSIDLNPAGIQDQSSVWVGRQVNCQLVRYERGNVRLEAAEQVLIKTPTEIEVVLSPLAKFNDGTRVTAEDVIASLEYSKKSKMFLGNLSRWVKELRRTGEQKLTIFLKHEVHQFLKVLSAPHFSIFPKRFLEKAKKNPKLWKEPIGCGKYRMTANFDNSDVLHLISLSDGLPIFFHLRGDNQIRAEEAGRYDIIGMPIIEGNLKASEFRKEKLLDPYHIYLALNTDLPRWQNVENRCQFMAQLDSSEPVKAYGADGERATDIFPRGVLGFNAQVDYSKELQKIAKEKGKDWRPANSSFCLGILGLSVPQTYRDSFSRMLTAVFPETKTTLITDAKSHLAEFANTNSQCDGMIFGWRSTYLDGYEYLLMLSEKNPHGFNPSLNELLERTQDLDTSRQRARAYQEVAKKIRDQCLLYPILTVSMKTIHVKAKRKTPDLGTVPLSEYYLGLVR